MATGMSRDTLDALEERLQTFLTRHRGSEGDALATQLASLECAYEALLTRLHRYESERAEIRIRLERILALMGRI